MGNNSGLILIKKGVKVSRIIYNRKLKKSDFTDFDGELIFFKDNNIAFVIVEKMDHVLK